MKFLGLDISSRNTGWTIMERGAPMATGDIAPPATADHPQKLNNFRDELLKICTLHKPDKICIEDVWAGKNKLTYKILSLYHGVAYQVSAEVGISIHMMTPSRFRRLVGAVHKTKLNYAEREDAKRAVGDLVCSLFPELSSASEDVCDSVGIALAAHYWYEKQCAELATAKTANPKIKSATRLQKIADDRTEDYFKNLEKENAKSVGDAGSGARNSARRNKKSV
jgi:Holliday junction resolvasome RuvABC endonuclease subunit